MCAGIHRGQFYYSPFTDDNTDTEGNARVSKSHTTSGGLGLGLRWAARPWGAQLLHRDLGWLGTPCEGRDPMGVMGSHRKFLGRTVTYCFFEHLICS